MPASIHVRAHAKVNLCLSVGPPEPPTAPKPGYHPIVSWFHAVSLWDGVRVTEAAGGIELRTSWAPDAPCPSPIDWPPERDLCVRAVALLEGEANRPLPVLIEVEKRIPVGGGLGGGSSDAAATLVAVNRLFSLGLSSERLRQLSARLGSDVAFFIDEAAGPLPATGGGSPSEDGPSIVARPAIVSGFGDVIERVEPCAGELVLVVPPFGCPTGPVYKALDALDRAPWSAEEQLALAKFTHRKALAGGLDGKTLFNHLTRPAIAVEPRVGTLLRATADAARRASCMSGSGSTVFVVCRQGEGESIADRLRQAIGADAGSGRRCAAVAVRLVGGGNQQTANRER